MHCYVSSLQTEETFTTVCARESFNMRKVVILTHHHVRYMCETIGTASILNL